jgi:hypothetical protein
VTRLRYLQAEAGAGGAPRQRSTMSAHRERRSPLRDAVVIDGRVGKCCVSPGETVPGVEKVAGKTATSLVDAGVGVEVGITAAHGAPVEECLIGGILFGEHPVQRSCLARPGAEDMGRPVDEPVQMARSATAPSILRCLPLEIPRDNPANIGVLKAVVRDTEGGEESKLADHTLCAKLPGAGGSLEEMLSFSVRQKPLSVFIEVTEKLASLLA